MREHREFPTFRKWLGGPIAEELTDDELERFRQESFKGAWYDLGKATDGCFWAVVAPLLQPPSRWLFAFGVVAFPVMWLREYLEHPERVWVTTPLLLVIVSVWLASCALLYIWEEQGLRR